MTKMLNISIVPVNKDEKEILKNLSEKYHYEFSQYNEMDINELGLYGYDCLDCYWTEPKLFSYFIIVDGKLAGFAVINDIPTVKMEIDYYLADFSVMYKYRRLGVGKYAVKYLFDMYKGKWQLIYHPKNETSKHFWQNVVSEYTKGKYELITDSVEARLEDGVIRHVMVFET